jgi:hypothetical protein
MKSLYCQGIEIRERSGDKRCERSAGTVGNPCRFGAKRWRLIAEEAVGHKQVAGCTRFVVNCAAWGYGGRPVLNK